MVRELSRRGVPVILDSEGEPLRLGVAAEPDLVAPNREEAEALVGHEFGDERELADGLDEIMELGAKNVLLTTEEGCFALLHDDRKELRLHARAPKLEPISTVGAGDVLLAGFLAARLAGRPGRGCASCRRRSRFGLGARGRSRPLRPQGGKPARFPGAGRAAGSGRAGRLVRGSRKAVVPRGLLLAQSAQTAP